MKDLTPAAMDVLARHHGVATHRMLTMAGVGRRVRQRLVAAGVLLPIHADVVRIASAPPTLHSECAALCLAHPHGFITGPTAGRLMDLRRMPATTDIHFCVRHGSNIGPLPGVELRQSTRIRPSDTVRRADGVTIASPPRLVFDLARDLSHVNLCSVIEQVVDRRLCTLATVARLGQQLVHPARPGSAQFVQALLSRTPGRTSQSHAEVLVDQALRARGIPVVRQVEPITLPNGRRIRIDLAVPHLRWGIEVDLHPDHLLLDGTARDKRRDRQCHLIGWQIERVTELDLLDLDGLIDELQRLYLARIEHFQAA
jgi:hypothetical protein